MMSTTRRKFIGQTSALGFSAVLGCRISRAFAADSPNGSFKRCVVLWMSGGPSQLDTFDPKDSAGPPSIESGVTGLRMSKNLSRLAERADELCVIRSVGSAEGEHVRATELLHTGFSPLPAFPRPSTGAMVAHSQLDPGFPRYVVLGSTGYGPAFLGGQHGPFLIQDISAARQQLERIGRRRRAMDLLSSFNDDYASGSRLESLTNRTSHVAAVRRLLSTRFPEVLDLQSVSDSERSRFGDQEFGQRMLTACRMLEIGVPYVEVQLDGWDTHIDNDRQTERLCHRLEQPWLAMMDRLQARQLWDDTLLVWMGEFGRTPRLNGQGGRDHFPEMIPVVLGGGHLGSKVIGETSADGSVRIGTRHRVADLMATLLTLMGVDISQTYTTDFGSPTTVTDDGTAIRELLV